MDQLIEGLKRQISYTKAQIETLNSAPRTNLEEVQKLKSKLQGLKDQLAILDTPEGRKRAEENRQSVMEFLNEEHTRQDEEDKNVQEDLQKLKEDVNAKEHFFQPRNIQKPQEPAHSTQELANLIRNKINTFFLSSGFHPSLEGTDTPFLVGHDSKREIKFNQALLESHRLEITELFKVLAGSDYYHLGLLKDGRPWANNEHDIEHLQAMATALGIIPKYEKPKIIEIEETTEIHR